MWPSSWPWLALLFGVIVVEVAVVVIKIRSLLNGVVVVAGCGGLWWWLFVNELSSLML